MTLRKLFTIALVAGTVVGVAACDDDEGPGPEVFVANLTGQQERPTPVNTTASGTARVEFSTTGLTYTVNVTGIANVTAAHIHGPATTDTSAAVVLNLNPNTTVTTGVLAQGSATATSVAAISMDSLKTMIRNGRAYVNVHNTANPGGHIRGQLTRQ